MPPSASPHTPSKDEDVEVEASNGDVCLTFLGSPPGIRSFGWRESTATAMRVASITPVFDEYCRPISVQRSEEAADLIVCGDCVGGIGGERER